MSSLDEAALSILEARYAKGLSSNELVGVCVAHGIPLSEASLRKYVQLGLLPRSVRVGQKGKHKGSRGLYPARTIRQLVRIKAMMSESRTIEEIRRDFLFARPELEHLEDTLTSIFRLLSQVAKQRKGTVNASLALRELQAARKAGRGLVERLTSVEERLLPVVGAGAGARVAEAARAS